MESWLEKVLRKLDREYDQLINKAGRLHKEGRPLVAERYESYAHGISHAIAVILEASKGE